MVNFFVLKVGLAAIDLFVSVFLVQFVNKAQSLDNKKWYYLLYGSMMLCALAWGYLTYEFVNDYYFALKPRRWVY